MNKTPIRMLIPVFATGAIAVSGGVAPADSGRASADQSAGAHEIMGGNR